jgi:CheY-like chemotaxis protein
LPDRLKKKLFENRRRSALDRALDEDETMTKILCIEDERFLREDIAEEMVDAGYQVLQACDGREGLDMIVEHKPDLVVSDISMPNMSGSELVVRLRSDFPQFADMPVIFLSALADRNDVLDGVRMGADDYLTKPIDYEMLIAKVEASLRHSDRMVKKKEQEQVTLYRELSHNNELEDFEFRWPEMQPRRIVLVGRSDKGLWHTQRLLEELGHDVQVFTSGRAYLDKIESNKLKADLALLWFHSDDMQAIMIPRMAADKSIPSILIVPEDLYKPGMAIERGGFLDALGLPMEDEQLVDKIKYWTEFGAAA